ncbi:MAG: hypothetical protein ABF330_06000 [Lentimonas sp.]
MQVEKLLGLKQSIKTPLIDEEGWIAKRDGVVLSPKEDAFYALWKLLPLDNGGGSACRDGMRAVALA